MAEEANRACYKVIRAGHRGALTRLMKEIDKVMAVEMLNYEHHDKLDVMYQQLESKAKVLGKLDNDIMKFCELGDIEREDQESDAITTKIIEYKARIESVKRPVNTSKTAQPTPIPLKLFPL